MKPSSFLLSLLALLGLALTTHSAAAQQLQGARWFFGERVGIDFTTGAPRFERGGQTQYFDATGSSVCDAAGRLQFYTDGWRVWNRRHQLMPNGVILPYPGYDKGLTTLTVPVQGKPWLYRVFQMASVSVADPRQITNRQSAAGAFGYFTVDMHRNGGRGDVVPDTGRAPLHIGISNALTAMIGPLGNTWVVAHASIGDAFYAWLVTEQGVEPPVVSHAGIAFDSAFAGTYPNGDRYGGADFNAISLKAAHSSELVVLTVNQRGLTQLFPFDVRTGTVGPLRQQILEDRVTGPFNPPLPPGIVYADTTVEAAALSTDLRYLYVNVWQPWLLRPGWRGVAYQYDLTAPDSAALAASRIAVYDDTVSLPRGLQLGPDGRIYFLTDSVYQRTPVGILASTLNVVTCPNERGAACGVRRNAVRFPYVAQGLYMPVLNQSFFRNAGRLQIVASNTRPCVGDTVRLVAFGGGVDTVTWNAAPGIPAGTTGAVQQFVVTTTGDFNYTVTGTRPCGAPYRALLRISPQVRPQVPSIRLITGILTTNGIGPFFQWLLNGYPIPGATGGDYTPTQSGTYAVVVGRGCTTQSTDLVVNLLGLADAVPNDAALAVWPNPATGPVRVRLAEAGPVVLLDAVGRVVRATRPTVGQELTWDVADLPAGLYVVRAGGQTRRLVVAR